MTGARSGCLLGAPVGGEGSGGGARERASAGGARAAAAPAPPAPAPPACPRRLAVFLASFPQPSLPPFCPRQVAYKSLISTIPLDTTLRWLGKPEWADGLQHSSSHIIGIGGWVVGALGSCRGGAGSGGRLGEWLGRPRCPAAHTARQARPGLTSSRHAAPAAASHRCARRACRRHPRPLPARPQVLAVLSRGRLPLLPHHRVQPLRQEELPRG